MSAHPIFGLTEEQVITSAVAEALELDDYVMSEEQKEYQYRTDSSELIYEAVKKNDMHTVQEMIDLGKEIHYDYIHYAIMEDQIDMAKFLVKNINLSEDEKEDLFCEMRTNNLLLAIQINDDELLKALIEEGAEPTFDTLEAVFEYSDPKKVLDLIYYLVDHARYVILETADWGSENMIELSLKQDYPELVFLFLKLGVPVSNEDLSLALDKGYDEAALELFKAGAKLENQSYANKFNKIQLNLNSTQPKCFDAIMYDDEDIIEYLNASKTNIVIVDEKDKKAYCTTTDYYETQLESALIYACKYDSMSPESVVTNTTYYRLNKLGIGSYVVRNYEILQSGKQLFQLFKTKNSIKHSVSKYMIDNPTTTSMISEPHCADGTGETIHVLIGYNWPPKSQHTSAHSNVNTGAGAGAGAGAYKV